MKRTITSIAFVGFVGSLLLGVPVFRGALSGIMPEVRIPGAVTKVHAQDRGCSVASLQGAYAFRRTGVNNVVGGPVAQIGVDIFNGDGTRGVLRLTGSQNGEIRDWTDELPGGSYTVDSDCTGSIFDTSGTKINSFVVLDGGKGYFLVSTRRGTIITAEGKRLDVKD